jgi:hypothetical protein
LNESDATRLWRKLFHGQAVTSQLLAEAELLVGELPGRKACEAGKSKRFVDAAQRSDRVILAVRRRNWNFKTCS